MECSTKAIAPAQTALIGTSVLPVKEITLGSLAQQRRDPSLISNNIITSLRPLTLECEASLSQVPFSMPSASTPLCSELSLSAYSQPSDFTHHSTHDTSVFQSENYPVLRSLLIECDYNPSVDLLSSEHNECNAPLVLAPFSQSASLKHTASSIDELPSHLQQFLLQHNISLISRTPLHAFTLMDELATHPNQNFVHELIHNIQHGCSIGYNGPQFSHCSKNLPSAYQQPLILDNALLQECNAGRILGPFDTPPLPDFRCSGLRLVPKHDGGWRTIYHLSAPHGNSINDYINPEDYTLSYCSVDDAYAILNLLGTGALMSKIDLKNAFRLIPVHPNDWNLLGICWRNKFYIDTCLPFGLRSAPFLFNQLSVAIHWILQHKYSVCHLLHYLDDFFTAGAPDSSECQNNLEAMLSLCQKINAPVKLTKVEGPSTNITFLGIVINTVTMTASISSERKQELLSALQSMIERRKCTKQQLLSLIGKLSFACKVVPAGRIFLRRLIDLSCSVSRIHHHIRLTKEARLDMYWWFNFLPQWSGTSCILETEWTTTPSMNLYTDASGTLGWGAYWSGRWLQAHWSLDDCKKDIVWKELFAIVAVVNSWGHHWQRKKVLFHCDNQSVCDIWHRGSSRSPEVMALVRMLYFCAAKFDINVMIAHIAGSSNEIADALSRFQATRFHQLAPLAEPQPDTILAWPTQFWTDSSMNINP